MGRWMFALLAAVLMLQGATVAAKAEGVDRAAGKNSDHPAGWQSAKAPDKRKCRAVYRKAGVFGIKPKHPWMRGRGAGYAESIQ